jgi:superfamily II DNA or RNA helicase
MSILFKLEELSQDIKERAVSELEFRPIVKKSFNRFGGGSSSNAQGKAVCPYYITPDNSEVYMPYSWSRVNIDNCPIPSKDDYMKVSMTYTGKLRVGQQEVKGDIIKMLNETGTSKLAFYPGFGKTSLSVYLASKIGLRVAVITHRIVLMDQWKKSFERFCPDSRVKVLKTGKKISDDDQVIIMNAENVEKFGHIFSSFGLVIVDEIHCVATESLIKSLFYFTPKYLIGLSATPTRPDGMDSLLDVYFGKNVLYKKLYRQHTYYQVKTGLEPVVTCKSDGTLDWNSLLVWQGSCPERNEQILKIIDSFRERHFLILCKRVAQADILRDALLEKGESVSVLTGGNNDLDESARIVIASLQKVGVGFSHDILDALIIAGDMEEYFVQYLGRVMRTEEVEPIVFDLVDNHATCKRHFTTRKKISQESGGSIKDFRKDFPDII